MKTPELAPNPLTVALVRGPGLSQNELDFLTTSDGGIRFVRLDASHCQERLMLRLGARFLGLRGGLITSTLSRSGTEALEATSAIWLPDPWLPLSIHAARIADRLRLPYVLTVWENTQNHPSERIPGLHSLTRKLLRQAVLIHCVSRRSAEYVARIDSKSLQRTIQVYPGVRQDQFSPTSRPPSVDSYRFLYVGRLVPEKGLPELLEAFSLLPDSDIELCIVGAGPLAPVVNRHAHRDRRIQFLGLIPHESIPSIYQSSHTLVLPSRSRRAFGMTLWEEQFGYVMVEAMSSGMNVIAAASGSIPEILGEAGILIRMPLTPTALADAMRTSARTRSEWESRSQAALAHARSAFDARVNSRVLINAVRQSVL